MKMAHLERILEKYPEYLKKQIEADINDLILSELKDWTGEVQRLLGIMRIEIEDLQSRFNEKS